MTQKYRQIKRITHPRNIIANSTALTEVPNQCAIVVLCWTGKLRFSAGTLHERVNLSSYDHALRLGRHVAATIKKH